MITPSTLFELDSVVKELHETRQIWRTQQQRAQDIGGRELPSRDALSELIEGLCGALFPMRLGPPDLRQENEDFYVGHTLGSVLHNLFAQVLLELRYQTRYDPHKESNERMEQTAILLTQKFAAKLPEIRMLLDSDVLAAYEGDPAARSVDEVLLCYPGILAIIHHRIAHEFYKLGVPLIARIIAEIAHSKTGIDLHPGAQIDAGFFIDHGTGVVIGETAVIGKKVRVYQAVTLGAKRFTSDENGVLHKGQLRHPIVEDEVVIYAGATILGRITIGKGSTIGGNVWLTHDVPAGSHVTQASSRHEDH